MTLLDKLLWQLFGIVIDVIPPEEAARIILSHTEEIRVTFHPVVVEMKDEPQ